MGYGTTFNHICMNNLSFLCEIGSFICFGWVLYMVSALCSHSLRNLGVFEKISVSVI